MSWTPTWPATSTRIPHDALVARVEAKIIDGRVLDLDSRLAEGRYPERSGAMDADTRARRQGAVISPLLANIYLDPLDKLMAARGFRMVRYADDFVILCRTREDADAALAEVRAWVAANGLTLHPTKTHVGDCRVPGQGFEFLGYRFEAGKRLVRKKSLDKLKDTIREKTGRNRGDSLERDHRRSQSHPCAAGSATSSMPTRTSSNPSTDRCGVGCALCC